MEVLDGLIWLYMVLLSGFIGKSWEYMGIPSGKHIEKAVENGHRNSELSHKTNDDFP